MKTIIQAAGENHNAFFIIYWDKIKSKIVLKIERTFTVTLSKCWPIAVDCYYWTFYREFFLESACARARARARGFHEKMKNF